MPNLIDTETTIAELLASPLQFTKVFYNLRTGREFKLSQPASKESHYITIFRYLKKVFEGEIKRLIINIPPRYGKTESLIHFVAWAIANYPDSNFLYVSYSHSLAKRQTQTIRSILNHPYYRHLFEIEVSDISGAKDDFETIQGGSVYAAGAGGTITGRGAGIQNCERFSGAIIIDDIHKPDEATSDTMREGVIDWYYNTLQSRLNSPNTPVIYIGQRVHEDDLAAHLINSGEWETLILPALDSLDNALHPSMHTMQDLLKMKEQNPYVFAAQYQQNPQPSGGSVFKPEWFCILDEEPEFLVTFITADTAETSKNYNDATAFSFWGLYKLQNTQNEYALHWIDCLEVRVEPKDLKSEFMAFYYQCCRHKKPPQFSAIEKKSTGVTLLSVLEEIRGMELREIIPNPRESKIERFLASQSYVAKRLISLPKYSNHIKFCLEHCSKITANNTHRFDDIADTLAYAINIALINKSVIYSVQGHNQSDNIVKSMMNHYQHLDKQKRRASWHM